MEDVVPKDHQIAIMKKLEKDRNKITPDDIIELKNSKIFRQAVTEIGTYDGLQKCSKKLFVLVRNLVMTEILIDNGQRAGVLANMTMEEFESTEKIVDDDGIKAAVSATRESADDNAYEDLANLMGHKKYSRKILLYAE